VRCPLMAKALRSWNSQRSPLANGATQHEENLELLLHRSRIANAINILIGATLDYSGWPRSRESRMNI